MDVPACTLWQTLRSSEKVIVPSNFDTVIEDLAVCIPPGRPISSGAYLVQVQHLVSSDAPSGLDIFHGQGEVDPSGVGQVEVIGVVLVPLLHRCKYLLLISADNV